MVPLYTGDYHGGTQYNYDYNGRLLIIVQPAKAGGGVPVGLAGGIF